MRPKNPRLMSPHPDSDVFAEVYAVVRAGGGALSRLILGSWWVERLIRADVGRMIRPADTLTFMGVPVDFAPDPYTFDVE